MKRRNFATAVLLSLTLLNAVSGEPTGIPWRPFPELPSLLWVQDFDHDLTGISKSQLVEAPKSAEPEPVKGKAPSPAAAPAPAKAPVASGSAMAFTEAQLAGTIEKVSVCSISLSATKLKFPDGQKTPGIFFYAQFWTEVAGEMTITLTTKDGPREEKRPLAAAKSWTPVTVRLSEFAGRGGRMKDTDLVTEIRFLFRPNTATTFQKAYVDNLIVTSGAKTIDEVLPFVDRALKKAHEMDRSAANDGFTYSESAADLLRTALKSDKNKRKNRSVLVFEPGRREPALCKALTTVASKAQFSGKFLPAGSPDQSAVGGLSDMRMLFRYNNASLESEFVLIPLSAVDARKGDSESVKVLIDRALAAGCIPVVCLPFVTDSEKAQTESFANAVRTLCSSKGVTYVEKPATAKDSPREPDSEALLYAKALKHLEVHFLRRK